MNIIIVARETSDLISKIVIFHYVPPWSSSLYTGFSRTVWGRRFREVDLTLPRRLGIFLKTNYAGWKLVVPNVPSSVYKSISALGTFYDNLLFPLSFYFYYFGFSNFNTCEH